MEIQSKVAIVTGASSGIGLATAKLLVSKGAKVALVSRNTSKLDEVSKRLPNSLSVPADMTKIEQIKAMVAKTESHFGQINVLINSAGQGYDATIEKIDANVFNYIFKLDVLGPVIAMQQVIPSMRKQGEGAIVNISSGLALMYLTGMSAYGSLKRVLLILV